MSISTDGEICYGALLDDEIELPWDGEEFDGEIDSWWIHFLGFEPSVEIYDRHGDFADGIGRSEIDKYDRELKSFRQKNPLPIACVNACSGDYPLWIIAIPDSVMTAWRGYPKVFDPAELAECPTAEWAEIILNFCSNVGILSPEEKPKWYLSSYWG